MKNSYHTLKQSSNNMSWGGARQGAGRKTGPAKKAITIRLSVDIAEKLPRDKSTYIEKLLIKEMKERV